MVADALVQAISIHNTDSMLLYHTGWVKVQFRGLELLRKKGTLFDEEFYWLKSSGHSLTFTYFSPCLQCILMSNLLP